MTATPTMCWQISVLRRCEELADEAREVPPGDERGPGNSEYDEAGKRFDETPPNDGEANFNGRGTGEAPPNDGNGECDENGDRFNEVPPNEGEATWKSKSNRSGAYPILLNAKASWNLIHWMRFQRTSRPPSRRSLISSNARPHWPHAPPWRTVGGGAGMCKRLQGRHALRPDRPRFPCRAKSGERKSQTDKHFGEGVRRYEREQTKILRPKKRKYLAALANWDGRTKGNRKRDRFGAKKGKDTADLEKKRLDHEAMQPIAPRIPRLLYEDATSEELAYQLSQGWPAGAIMSSEGGAVFGSHSMQAENVTRCLSLWNGLWSGERHVHSRRTQLRASLSRTRASRFTSRCKRRCCGNSLSEPAALQRGRASSRAASSPTLKAPSGHAYTRRRQKDGHNSPGSFARPKRCC